MSLPRFQHFIDGAFADAAETFESLDPATGKAWAIMPTASEVDVNRAVEAADRAFNDPAWAGLTATQRGKLLTKLGDLIAEHTGRLAELETRDTGKIIRGCVRDARQLRRPRERARSSPRPWWWATPPSCR